MKKVFGFAFVLALFSVSAAPVFAATTSCNNNTSLTGKIPGNLDVPAGATCTLNWAEVTGNVTVEGTLVSVTTKFDHNVTVTGGSIQITNGWGDNSKLVGNLTITGSAANSGIYCAVSGNNIIGGNITFEGNTGRFYVCQADVAGGVTVDTNTRNNTDFSGGQVADLNNIHAGKNISCFQNVRDPNWSGNPVTGSGNNAPNKTGDCAGL